MIRATGFVAVFLSLALALLLFLRIRHERYAGPVLSVGSTEFVVDVLEGPEHGSEEWTVRGIYGGPLPQPPSTMGGSLSGTQRSKMVTLTIPAPPSLLEHVVRNAPAEIRHLYLDLPGVGPLVGTTSYVIGSYEGHGPRWPLYGVIAVGALAPLIAWGGVAGLISLASGLGKRCVS